MITVRRAAERGHFDHGWLDTYHTFSFGDYHDPDQMGYRVLKVINEDRVRPGEGFPTHGHRDMEIVTFVFEGALVHRDSMGNGSVIRAGEVQRMSAGTGITHSEYNHSRSDPVHFLQIWILPERNGLKPSYQQKAFPDADKRDTFRLVASRDGREGSVRVHQDCDLYITALEPDGSLRRDGRADRYVWLQVVRGVIDLNGISLEAGDGAAVENEVALDIRSESSSEFLLFDLP